jgi:flavodoxin
MLPLKEDLMNVLVVFDSRFGNTERIARAIGETLGAGQPARILAVDQASARDIVGVDLLAVGGPTQGHGLSPALKGFLDRLSSEELRDVPIATFDTRLKWPRILAGSAAVTAAKHLTKKGAKLLTEPESFLVARAEGPLVEGELQRARSWARHLLAGVEPAEQAPVGAGR